MTLIQIEKIDILSSMDIKEHPHYDYMVFSHSAMSNDLNTRHILHNYGALYRLMKHPENYNPSTFCICYEKRRPVSIVSVTENSLDSQRLLSYENISADELDSVKYPCFEFMAFTNERVRCKGFATIAIQELLQVKNIQSYENIYVYSNKMLSIFKNLGYEKTINLHLYNP